MLLWFCCVVFMCVGMGLPYVDAWCDVWAVRVFGLPLGLTCLGFRPGGFNACEHSYGCVLGSLHDMT